MFNIRSDKSLVEELGQFPVLLIKPWRLQELVEEEITVHRYRLFRSITWIRLALAVVLSFIFLFTDGHKLLLSISASYAVLTVILLFLSRGSRDRMTLYALFYALFDILILGYVASVYTTRIEVGFVFLSVIFSSILLSLFQLNLIVILSSLVIIITWGEVTFDHINEFFFSGGSHLKSIFYEKLSSTYRFEEIFMLIIGMFVIAILTNRLANWSMNSEVKAQFRHKQTRQVLSFNRSVIEHLKNGIIVFTANARIISINKTAIELLNLRDGQAIMKLSDLSPKLSNQYQNWASTLLGTANAEDSFAYRHNEEAEEVFISFSRFGRTDQNNIVMMTIESINKAVQQNQEAKLSALGRLTAGVAHEIRNPLSSINSAAQLLDEGSDNPTQKKLSQMILNNVQRTNQIISDILGLFKDKKTERDLLPVKKTLEDFVRNFMLSNKEADFEIVIERGVSESLYFRFDLGQLEQILWNLCSNAIKYATVDSLKITLYYELSVNRKLLYLMVYDNGLGIAEEKIPKIFEPFYTTGGASGSGLGLYLVRELCSTNNASIVYLPPQDRKPTLQQIGACFRVSVPVYFSQNIKPQID